MKNIRLDELSRRLYWFINIRWLAIIVVIATINFAKFFQLLHLPYTFLYFMSGILTISNISYLAFYSYSKNNKSLQLNKKLINGFANLQVFIDLIILTLLLYGTGGLHSPFIYYYLFHMVIASMLLAPFWAFVQGGIAIGFFAILIMLSLYHLIPYYSLPGLGPDPGEEVYVFYVVSRLGGLVSTMFIMIFMACSISKRLNRNEELLKQVNEELAQANDEKSKYIIQVTHELRSPLAAIQGYLKVALEGYIGPVDGKLRDMLQSINNRTTNMLSMVNELLDLANLKKPGKTVLKKEPYSARILVNRTIHLLENGLIKKKINIQTQIDDKTEILVDAEQFCIVLSNIINNSIKYSRPEGAINIEAQKSNRHILFKIEDYGIGIPAKDLNHVFQEYYRAQNAVSMEKDGTGLGLAIAENIIKKHKGSIWVESKESKGTTFFVELPV